MKKTGFLEITNITAGHAVLPEDEASRFTVRVTEDGRPWSGRVAGFSRYLPSWWERLLGVPLVLKWDGPFDETRSDPDGLATLVLPGQAAAPGIYEVRVAAMAEGDVCAA